MAQQQYSAGDRIRVSLAGAVYNAAVIKVHVGDADDVVFAKAGNVGVSLTAAGHILELELIDLDVVKVRVSSDLNRCSRVTCRVVQCAYAWLFASQFLFVGVDPSCHTANAHCAHLSHDHDVLQIRKNDYAYSTSTQSCER